MNKEKIIDQLIELLKIARDIEINRQKTSQNEANMHIGAMESRYDTFKEEAQYLAGAQEIRSYNLNQNIVDLQKLRELVRQNLIPSNRICLGSIVLLENESGEKKLFFIACAAGGQLIETSEGSCQIITPVSPMGRAIVGKKKGDEIQLLINGKLITFEVIAIE